MLASAPLAPNPDRTPDGPRHTVDEDDLARWAAFYEILPVAWREALDDLGQEVWSAKRR